MAQPPTSRLAEQAYREVLPLAYADESLGWPLLYLIESVASTAREIEDLVRDTDDYPGWSAAVDIDRAPDRMLDWLAQFMGVGQNKGLDADQYRQRIRDAEGMKRGTPAAMLAAAKTYLTGTKRAEIRERTTSAYALQLITYTSETPDPAKVCAAVTALKPAGLVLTCSVYDGWVISEMEAHYVATTDTITFAEAEFTSLNNFESRIP